MAHRVPVTLAAGPYAIVAPLADGRVRPDGIELTVLTRMDSSTRHWRFLRNREFDMAEVSASSYLVARDRGLPFRAIPVFLHRRFRHGFIFVNTASGVRAPADLIGRRVGVKEFQATAIVWMRGILEHEYGVPHRSIEWFAELDENVEFEPPAGLRLHRLRPEQSVEQMLLSGELDAVLHPDLIRPIRDRDPRVARLFPNYREEETAYYQKTGIFPIMHVMGMKQELVERYPWIAVNMYLAFEEAKAIAMRELENPRVVPLVFYRDYWEEQEALFGKDPWEYGLGERNARTLRTLIGYAREQGQIGREPPLDELFLNVSVGRKRGDSSRI